MRIHRFRNNVFALLAVFALALSGCFSSGGGGGGGGGGSSTTVEELRLEPLLETLPVGFALQFEATAMFSDGTSRIVTDETAWRSTDPGIADFDEASIGTLIAREAGQTGIIATFGGTNATAQVEVRDVQLERIDVEPGDPLELAIGETRFLTATAVYEGGLSLDVTDGAVWHSGDEHLVSVDNSAFPGLVTGVVETSQPVDVWAEFGGEASAPVEVTVTGAMLMSISVEAPSSEVKQGAIVQFTATARFSDNPDVDINVTEQVIWSAEPGDRLEIRNDPGFHGKAAGRQPGSVTVTATMGSEWDSVPVEVIAAPAEPRRLNLSAIPNVVVNGDDTSLRAEVTANDPSTQVLDSLVRFSLIGGGLELDSPPEAQTVAGIAEIQATATESGLALVFAEVEGTLAQGFAWVMVVPALADAISTSYAVEDGNYVFRAANLSNRVFELVAGDIGNGRCEPSEQQLGTQLQTGDRLVIPVPQNSCGMNDPTNRTVTLTFKDLPDGPVFEVTITESD